jgi:hypothetical protein
MKEARRWPVIRPAPVEASFSPPDAPLSEILQI